MGSFVIIIGLALSIVTFIVFQKKKVKRNVSILAAASVFLFVSVLHSLATGDASTGSEETVSEQSQQNIVGQQQNTNQQTGLVNEYANKVYSQLKQKGFTLKDFEPATDDKLGVSIQFELKGSQSGSARVHIDEQNKLNIAYYFDSTGSTSAIDAFMSVATNIKTEKDAASSIVSDAKKATKKGDSKHNIINGAWGKASIQTKRYAELEEGYSYMFSGYVQIIPGNEDKQPEIEKDFGITSEQFRSNLNASLKELNISPIKKIAVDKGAANDVFMVRMTDKHGITGVINKKTGNIKNVKIIFVPSVDDSGDDLIVAGILVAVVDKSLGGQKSRDFMVEMLTNSLKDFSATHVPSEIKKIDGGREYTASVSAELGIWFEIKPEP